MAGNLLIDEAGGPPVKILRTARIGQGFVKEMIYLDYHAHAPLDPRVALVLADAFIRYDANPHAAHEPGEAAHQAVEHARRQVATMLRVEPSEIVFTSGATEANNMAIRSFSAYFAAQDRPAILASAGEHPSILNALPEEAHQIALCSDGILDFSALERLQNSRTGLVSVAAANHEIGTIQPLGAISEAVRANGSLVHSDLAQAAGHISVDPQHYDLASISAHKLGGPVGIGALVVKRRLRRHLRALIEGGGQEGGLRPGTVPTPLCVAFGEACRIASEDMASDNSRVGKLRDKLQSRLGTAGDMIVHGGSARLAGNLNISFAGVDGEALVLRLRKHLAISTGSACTSAALEPSHVLRAIGVPERVAEGAIRLGLGRRTTASEIESASALILEAVADLRATVRNAA